MSGKSGAGVIPYAIRGGKPLFLFHTTFSGRRAGLIVDFGGGSEPGETPIQTAAREFVEETDGMFLDASGEQQHARDSVASQCECMLRLIARTRERHPAWRCSRQDQAGNIRDWATYFVHVEYRRVDEMNRAWAQDREGRFRKRRELFWLSGEDLLEILEHKPERMWKRVLSLQGLQDVVRDIIAESRL